MHPPNGPPPQATYGKPPMPQYATGVPPEPMVSDGKWSTGFCDCRDDVSNCCITCWCPCITFGQIAEIVDKGTTYCGVHGTLYTVIALFTGCQWIYSCMYRSKMSAMIAFSIVVVNDVHYAKSIVNLSIVDLICLLDGMEIWLDRMKESRCHQLLQLK